MNIPSIDRTTIKYLGIFSGLLGAFLNLVFLIFLLRNVPGQWTEWAIACLKLTGSVVINMVNIIDRNNKLRMLMGFLHMLMVIGYNYEIGVRMYHIGSHCIEELGRNVCDYFYTGYSGFFFMLVGHFILMVVSRLPRIYN